MHIGRIAITGLLLGATCISSSAAEIPAAVPTIAELAEKFRSPPATARPWVYWTWLSSNVSRESITADLEAMQRVGIGGALILDVENGTPPGPMTFFDAQWQAMLTHTVAEAKRLGLEINVNNGPGYYGSGGPWVTPDLGMQWVFASETPISGGRSWAGILPIPANGGAYHDVGVFAVPARTSTFKIDDFKMKALYWDNWVAYRGTRSAPLTAQAPADALIPVDRVIDLSARMAKDGSLSWDVPAGQWVLLRMGYAYNGRLVGPSPKGQSGAETDKLSRAATTAHFNTFVKRLSDITGPAMRSALVGTHIDSWEGGGQNWTASMREEFKKRRGYDPLLYLPIMTDRVLGDLQTSERFLWDLRTTVSELMVENYVVPFKDLAHQQGLRFSFESYTTTGNDLNAANYADEPMAEFWTPNGQGGDFYPTAKSMSSAAHLNQRAVVGAEAFTSGGKEKWLWHPAMFKDIGDDAFTQGVNRFVFHRYAAQRFADRQPGMQMGPWGLHYERTNTWWEWAGPWHAYVTRCQYLLRQGESVADVLNLQTEEPLLRFQVAPLTGYDYDACGPDTLSTVRTQQNRLTLPSGRAYRLLVLSHTGTMTVKLLTHIRDLVRDGAAILGERPLATPGLTGYPHSESELKQLTDELWGTDPQATAHKVGLGTVFCGITPEQALAKLALIPDFVADHPLRWIHRSVSGSEIYFIANPAPQPVTALVTCRVAGRQPELWNTERGTIARAAFFTPRAQCTEVSLRLQPKESVFLVFPAAAKPLDPVVSLTRDGQALALAGAQDLRVTKAISDKATNGIADDPLRTSTQAPAPWMTYGSNGELILSAAESGTYVATTATGKTTTLVCAALAPALTITGPWQVACGSQVHQFEDLHSWSDDADEHIRYFSGTAHYTKTVTIAPAMITAGTCLALDLGQVAIMARVTLNGKDLGILWKPPYCVDITAAAVAGDNHLDIAVVNLWPNRLIGDEQLPEDSERNKNGTLKAWPSWLLDGKPSPTGRQTFASWRLWKKNDHLQPSGLLGPVVLQQTARVVGD